MIATFKIYYILIKYNRQVKITKLGKNEKN